MDLEVGVGMDASACKIKHQSMERHLLKLLSSICLLTDVLSVNVSNVSGRR